MKDEFSFIQSIQPTNHHHPTVITGIGDDAALYDTDSGYHHIATVDTVVEDIHFSRRTMTPFHIGYKALAVNISDIAAMGGQPLYYLVSISVPQSGWSEEELREIYEGMSELALKHHVDLIGGDTNSTRDTLVVSVTVIGRVEKGRKLLRSNAEPGDVVFVTGSIGSSAAGLDYLLKLGLEAETDDRLKSFLRAHQKPEPQVKAGRLLAQLNKRVALNDISDGIASEANEIAEASEVKIELEYEDLPFDTELANESPDDKEQWMLFGGEDFQLIGCVGEENWTHLKETFAHEGVPLHKVGYVKEGRTEVMLKKDGTRIHLEKRGFNHFNKGD
ncbi:thiamine-phosphate kinase [Alteribacter populi]|uniref:thiamine-phosphate kinase n=1 Tax=Alteribacter populi TaxID=2011011 RepID=UPI000BBB50F4|nr:thiamine-phosphate kinase [Alteribacter populi]